MTSKSGNLINAPELKQFLDEEGHRHINTESDSYVFLDFPPAFGVLIVIRETCFGEPVLPRSGLWLPLLSQKGNADERMHVAS